MASGRFEDMDDAVATAGELLEENDASMAALALDPDAVARAVEFAIDQPWDVEIGELSIRPTRQG